MQQARAQHAGLGQGGLGQRPVAPTAALAQMAQEIAEIAQRRDDLRGDERIDHAVAGPGDGGADVP